MSRGYSVLTRIAGVGVDTFVKEENSLFVFFQGHPEYDSDTLLREYRRDVGRYLNHEATTYPSIPRGYFDSSTEGVLTALRDKAMVLSERANCLRVSVLRWKRQESRTHGAQRWRVSTETGWSISTLGRAGASLMMQM